MVDHVTSSLNERMDMLKQTQWGTDLTAEQIERLAQYLYVAKISKDEQLFVEGSKEAYMCFIVGGLVKIAKGDSRKQEKTISEIGAGRTFGEMSIIDGLPRSASATAGENTTMLILSKENFELLLNDNPKLGIVIYSKLAQLMSHRLRVSDWMLVEYLY